MTEYFNLINGKREGKWEFYWSNGDLQQTVTYKNDVPVNGVKLFFDKDWKKITDNNKDKFAYYRVIAYENGKWTNPVRDYYANGTLQMEAYYRSVELAISSEENLENEVIDNTPVKFFHKNGKLQRIVHFLNGKKHGEEKTYHNNGKLEASGFFVDGKREGLFKYNTKYNYSWDNGKPSSSEHYVNDKREGECKYYYKNGELNTSGFFVDGKREGEFKYYWDNGDLKQTVTYKNNLPVSDLKLFFDKDWKETKDKDKLAYYRVIKYENGKWANPIKDHYANGTLQMEAYYKSEELALSTEGNVESKVINETPVKWFYRNGKLQKVAHFLNGTKDGEYKSYYENGQLQYEIHYYIDIETGVFNWYHSNGQLLRSTKYQHEPFDKKNWDGLHKHTYAVEAIAAFDKYGNKLDKGTLKKGRGTLHLYDENGNLEKSIKIKNGYQVEESTTKKL